MKGLPVIDGVILSLTSLLAGYITLDVLLRFIQRINNAYVVFALGALIMIVGITGI
jgi:hypothetical protein